MRFGVVLPIQDTQEPLDVLLDPRRGAGPDQFGRPEAVTGADHLPGRRGVLEDTVAYASQRHAFGKPIGQMQAIQHGIADIAMKLDGRSYIGESLGLPRSF